GRHFRDYHLLLDEQASQLFPMVDEIAERARKLGGGTLRSVSEITRNQRLRDTDDGLLSPTDMLKELLDDNRQLTQFLRSTHEPLRSAPRRCHGQPARELDRRSRAANLVPRGNNVRQLATQHW